MTTTSRRKCSGHAKLHENSLLRMTSSKATLWILARLEEFWSKNWTGFLNRFQACSTTSTTCRGVGGLFDLGVTRFSCLLCFLCSHLVPVSFANDPVGLGWSLSQSLHPCKFSLYTPTYIVWSWIQIRCDQAKWPALGRCFQLLVLKNGSGFPCVAVKCIYAKSLYFQAEFGNAIQARETAFFSVWIISTTG